MKRPPNEALMLAVEWLRCYEGDGQAECEAVATWLVNEAVAVELREVARKNGVPVAALRRKIMENVERKSNAVT